jgi:hypothetical protein
MLNNLDFENLKEAHNKAAENPEKITDALLGLTHEEYETMKPELFRQVFPDEKSIETFILRMHEKKNLPKNDVEKIVDYIISLQRELALFYSEFSKDGEVSLGEVKRRITDITKSPAAQQLQGELFPVFSPQKTVELKKEFALNFGALEKIEKEYKGLMKEKLSSGLTLKQHIDRIKNWFNDLHGDDLGNWIKLFAYIKAVKIYNETNEDPAVNFRTVGEGRYCFSIKQNKQLFSYFIRPDKKTGQYTTKAKNKFLKWLHENQNAIEFPIIMNGKVWNIPMHIYQYAESVGNDKEILFVVDTNILESEFKDYVSIPISEIDTIADAWETIAQDNADFAKYRLNNFVDIPLKFLLTLKTIYTRNGNYKNGEFAGNVQTLSKERLDEHLGGLSDRILKHLISSKVIRTGKTGEKPLEVKRLILKTIWTIAIERKWLITKPIFDKESNVYKFNINAGYFDRRDTAKRLQSL